MHGPRKFGGKTYYPTGAMPTTKAEAIRLAKKTRTEDGYLVRIVRGQHHKLGTVYMVYIRSPNGKAQQKKSIASMPPSEVRDICGPTYRKFGGKRYAQTKVQKALRATGNNRQALKEHAERAGRPYRIVKTRDICPYRYMLYTRT